jgi:hypothetical protein
MNDINPEDKTPAAPPAKPEAQRPPTLNYAPPPPQVEAYTIFLFVCGFLLAIGGLGGLGVVLFMMIIFKDPSPTRTILFIGGWSLILIGGLVGIYRFRGRRRPFLLGLSSGLIVISLIEGICFA